MPNTKTNKRLMEEAREALSGKWGLAIGTFLVAGLVSAFSSILPILGPILIGGPLSIGMAYFFLNIARNKEAKLSDIFEGFENFGNAIGTYILTALAVLGGTVCFIIPGIIIALMLSQVFYIVADDKNIRPMDALKKSREMMDGHKLKLFGLYLRFIGWGILCLFTFGIGFFWLVPYVQVSLAKFYDNINAGVSENTNEMNSPLTLTNIANYQSPTPQQSRSYGNSDYIE